MTRSNLNSIMKGATRLLLVTLFAAFYTACSINKLTIQGVYKELSAPEYELLVKQGNLNIIDVRTVSEFEKSHITSAINVSFLGGNFSRKISELDLDTSKTTLIYCETQHRSLFVANKLHQLGFNTIIDLDRGMRIWRKEGHPFSSSIEITDK